MTIDKTTRQTAKARIQEIEKVITEKVCVKTSTLTDVFIGSSTSFKLNHGQYIFRKRRGIFNYYSEIV